MIKEIKALRVEIDGLAQLTKELCPFKWMVYQRPKIEKGILGGDSEVEKENVWTGHDSGLIMVGEKVWGLETMIRIMNFKR